jgi:hypothetical protein
MIGRVGALSGAAVSAPEDVAPGPAVTSVPADAFVLPTKTPCKDKCYGTKIPPFMTVDFRVAAVGGPADYRAVDAHLNNLAHDGIRGLPAAAIAQADDAGEASRLYREYLQGQYVLADQAAVLTVATASTGADIGTTLATFRAMRKYDNSTQARAALFATTPDPIAAYNAFRDLTSSGVSPDAAALLAHARNPTQAREAYGELMRRGATAIEAAMIASVGVSSFASTDAILRAYNALPDRAVLVAAALASHKAPADLTAASDHFGGVDGDLTAAAWAVRDDHAMATIVSARFMQQSG